MRYLVLAAEYTQSALRDENVGHVVPEEVGLSWELGGRIRDWNERYRRVIPLDPEKRTESETAELIATLDAEGLALTAEIADALGDAKVRYYSEGHLRYVP